MGDFRLKSILIACLCLSSAFVCAPASAAVIYELEWSGQPVITFTLETPDYVLKNRTIRSASTLTSCYSIYGTCSGFYFDEISFNGGLLDSLSFFSRTPRGAGVTTQLQFANGAFSKVGTHQEFFNRGASLKISNTNIAAPVPEPATWALMLLGFAAVGSAMRKKAKFQISHSYIGFSDPISRRA